MSQLKTLAVAGLLAGYFADVSKGDAAGYVLAVPMSALVSVICTRYLILHPSATYIYARALGSGDVSSATIHGAAASRAVQTALMAQLKDTHKLIRGATLGALQKMDNLVDVQRLCALLRDPEIDVHNKAVDVVIKANHPDTVRFLIDVLKDDKPQYRLETRERSLADCVPTCWWQQTSPLSHFTQSTICSRLTPGGRVSISGRMLIQTQDGTRTEQQLDTDDALLAAYRDHFGVALSRVPDDPAG